MKVLVIDKSTLYAGAEQSLKILLDSAEMLSFIDILFDCKLPHQSYYEIPFRNIKYRYNTSNGIINFLQNNSDKRIFRGIRNLIKAFYLLFFLLRNKYGLVHFNMYRSSDIFDILICRMLGIKVISHVRTLASVINIPITSRILVNHFICVSKVVSQGFALGIKSSVIYDSIDFHSSYLPQSKDEFKRLADLPSGSLLISSIGQLEYRKAHDIAIKIMPDLLKKYPNAILLIIGSDPSLQQEEYNRLLAIINDFRLNAYVILRLFTEDIELIYKASDIVISITREGESFGRIPIEAAVYGTPCVVTNIGAFKETVKHYQTGLVCEPEDTQGLLESVETLIQDKVLYANIVKNAEYWARENFSGDVQREKIKDVYKSIMEA